MTTDRVTWVLRWWRWVIGLFALSTIWVQAQSLPQPLLITDRQGLPQSFVPSILQDHQGFIWAATRDGLCRYDGRHFKIFQPDPNGKPSLSFAGLEQLAIDYHGRIWIVSERGDIDIFDPRTENFVNFSRQPAFRQLTNGQLVGYQLRLDQQDRLWLMPLHKGLICWDLKTNRGRWFHHEVNRPESLGNDEVNNAVTGSHGVLWLTTTNGLDRFDPDTQQFTHYRHQAGNPHSLPDNHLTGLCRRPNGDIVLMSRQHISILQPLTGRIRAYQLPAQAYQLQSTHFTIDRKGSVYFNKDAILFEFTDKTGVRVAAAGRAQHTKDCASLFIDRTNVLWVGTTGAGIRTYDLQPNPFQTRPYNQGFHLDLLTSGELGLPPISPSVIVSLKGLISYNFRSTFDSYGRFWFNVGSSDVYRLDLKTRKTDHFPLPASFRSKEAGGIPCPLATDPQGGIWVVYNDTAFRYDEASSRWIRFPYALPNRTASDLLELVIDEQALWMASRAGGLWRLDRRTGKTHQFTNNSGDPTSISSNSLYCVSADPTDPNRLWIGTFGNGLCLFDKRTGKSRRFSQSDGLPNNVIYSAISDQQGYLWMGTNKGLCRMNRRTFSTRIFTRDDGILADEFNRYHYLKFPDGTILMGGLEGFTVFNPAQVSNDQFDPFLELTELEINNQVVNQNISAWGGTNTDQRNQQVISPLGNWPIQATDQIILAHNQNYITVRFAALQFNRPGKNRYRYRMEGLEENWKQTDRPEAVYTNLLPGHYVLTLNASNTSGRWSRYVRKLRIIIKPPIWATWWAISFYAMAALGIAWVMVLVWLNRLRLKQSIQLRQQEADQLRAVDTLKTTFFTNITHELRTPLTLILAPTQQMLTESRPDKDVSRLSTIDRQAHQLLGLINQWLDFSKLEAGTLPVQSVRGELGKAVGEWVGHFLLEAQVRNIELIYEASLPGVYWFDLDRLERIVLNLLSNAVKFTPDGGHIQVELNPSPTEGVQLIVTDTGVGIPAEALPHIFERFYQADNSQINYQSQLGSGIGLALVHDLVALQGGTISVRSELHQGTQFTVWFPYKQADSLTVDQLTTQPAVPTPGSTLNSVSSTQKLTSEETPVVLLVEDNPELASFIADSLSPTYQINRAVNGQQGFEQALALLPDLVISDVLMPVLDGYGLCQLLKTDIRTNHVPIILLTARASLDSKLEGLALGADDYLTKPFHVRELQLRVSNLLAQRRRLREHIRASLTTLDVPARQSISAPTDPFITKLYSLIEAHLDQSAFGVEQLATQVGMSRSYLFRKVKVLTGLSASELERNYRLQRATHYLQQGYAISQTAYLVGFETPTYFTQSFRKLYGITPTDYLSQRTTPQ